MTRARMYGLRPLPPYGNPLEYDLCETWLYSLSTADYKEFSNLLGNYGPYAHKVREDWIEEHGGKREWDRLMTIRDAILR